MSPEIPQPAIALQALVAEHGLVRVALALAALIARRRPPPRRYDADLSDRIRRDIGLVPRPESRKYWDL
ncbi:hypothetical protein [Defluviimonas sp. SAOS-178_SWC]|uniref:hypothetical protein n=1 Tax=Defluviimonas sp. SAOS-178_SWC TaxID=3121287 RepID=UPI0032215559